jgi:hypothetical protein
VPSSQWSWKAIVFHSSCFFSLLSLTLWLTSGVRLRNH